MGTQGQAKEIVFLSGKRTGFGTFGGSLRDFTATDLGVFASDKMLNYRNKLATDPLRDRRDHVYLGLGLLLGYRWVSTGGWFAEPALSYEYFAGPRPLVPGSQEVQDGLGLSLGVALGLAW